VHPDLRARLSTSNECVDYLHLLLLLQHEPVCTSPNAVHLFIEVKNVQGMRLPTQRTGLTSFATSSLPLLRWCRFLRSSLRIQACMQSIESKPPFSQYAGLQGVKVVYGNPMDPRSFPEEGFDIVYDNNGKSLKECKALIDTYAPKVCLHH
jgi:hypothetical protein